MALLLAGGAGGAGINVTIGGNTAGVGALVSSGTLTLAGGPNLTVSQDGNAISVSAAAQSVQTQVMSAGISGGNTAGDTGTVSRQLVLAGGNNVTLSGSTNGSSMTITVSAAAQTEQTQSRFNLTLSGNTAGALALISSGVMTLAGGNNITLSQAGNAVTISAFSQTAPVVSNAIQSVGTATVSGTNTSRFAADDHVHAGVPVAGISGGNTAGQTGTRYGSVAFAGGANITLSGATAAGGQTITISGGGGGAAPTLNIFDNQWAGTLSSMGTSHGTLWVYPLAGVNNVFPGNMTVETAMLMLSGNMTGATSVTGAQTYSLDLGIYTLSASSTLNLLNSAQSTWAYSANSNNSSMVNGARWLTLASSLFSAQFALSQTNYWLGLLIRSSGVAPAMSWLGIRHYHTGTASGTVGTSGNTNNSSLLWGIFAGRSSVSRSDLPSTIHRSALRGEDVGLMPRLVLNNVQSVF